MLVERNGQSGSGDSIERREHYFFPGRLRDSTLTVANNGAPRLDGNVPRGARGKAPRALIAVPADDQLASETPARRTSTEA